MPSSSSTTRILTLKRMTCHGAAGGIHPPGPGEARPRVHTPDTVPSSGGFPGPGWMGASPECARGWRLEPWGLTTPPGVPGPVARPQPDPGLRPPGRGRSSQVTAGNGQVWRGSQRNRRREMAIPITPHSSSTPRLDSEIPDPLMRGLNTATSNRIR